MNRGFGFFFLSCLHGMKECFVPFSPRKTIGWLAVIQMIITSGCFGAAVFLVVFRVVPPLSITAIVITIVAFVTSITGVVGFALDNPELYLAYMVLSLAITTGNVLALFYFTYIAIQTSMEDLYRRKEFRWNHKYSDFNWSIACVTGAFAIELILFISSAFIAVRARANAIVRIENDEIDALLQDADDNLSQVSLNRSYTEQIEAQTRILNASRISSRNGNSSRNSRGSYGSTQNSLTQSQQSLPR